MSERADARSAAPRNGLRRYAGWLRKTPLHPQWHMRSRSVDPALSRCEGLVLDIGSADGWLRAFLSPSASYISLDYPITALGLYRSLPEVFGDAASLPFADRTFSGVACYEVLEHVRQPEEVIAEIARVLIPGGVAELSMPFLYPVHDAPHDYQRWTRHGWERSIATAGLTVEKLKPLNHSLASAAVLACLALVGPLEKSGPLKKITLLPLGAMAVLVINLVAWFGMLFWPGWSAMTTGHRILVRKQS